MYLLQGSIISLSHQPPNLHQSNTSLSIMSAPAPKFSELDFEKDYDENKDQDYSPGDDIDTYYSP